MKEKRTFAIIFALLAVFLAVLPFLVTFNEALTHLVEKFRLYMWVQERIVPLEVKMVGVLVAPLGINYLAHQNGMTVNGTYAGMTWNCIGWQSLLFFLITAFVGLQGDKYSNFSKFKALIIGLLGTFLVNLFRIAFVALVAFYFGQNVAIIFHDYGSTLAVLGWLFFFWWFAYSFVLEERRINSTTPEKPGIANFSSR